jgi:DNA-binding MarR family transcriptional regulator
MSDETFHRFLILYRHLRQQARRMNSQGIRPPQFAILRFLLESGSATVGEVQEYLYHSASTASTMIAQLEEAGYVTRTRSQEDNRVVIVELTPTGQDVAENTPMTGLPLLRRRLKTLPQDRLLLINEALAEIMQLMEVPEKSDA